MRIINKTIHIIAAGLLILGINACDSGFESMNKNPNQATETSPDYLFNYLTTEMGGQLFLADINHRFLMKWVMQSATPWGNSTYPPYDYMTATNIKTMWSNFYSGPISNVTELINQTKDDPDLVNKYAIARILKAYTFHIMTDLWGDIPYTEAAKGLDERILKPKYDTQETIYADMLNELKEAATQLDPEKPMFAQDQWFGGSLDNWRKFANSLRLRLAMRSANSAVVSELMQADDFISSNAESARFQYLDNIEDWNPFYDMYYLKPDNPTSIGKISKLMFDQLLTTGDPRITLYCDPVMLTGDTTAGLFLIDDDVISEYESKGMETEDINALSKYGKIYIPLISNLKDFFKTELGEEKLEQYKNFIYKPLKYYRSAPNLLTVDEIRALGLGVTNTSYHGSFFTSDPDAYHDILTYSEVCFLKAEAALRGWGGSATEAKDYYEEGIRANWEQLGVYNESSFSSFLDNSGIAFDSNTEKALEQIITQKWVSLYLNGFETFAEYRRTGYPELIKYKITLDGKKVDTIELINAMDDAVIAGSYPNRIYYPENEVDLNNQNYLEAVSRQGEDKFTTKIWWIKQNGR